VAWVLTLREEGDPELRRRHVSGLVAELAARGFGFASIDVSSEWSDLNDDRNLARFVFGTKAETLARLEPRLRHATIQPQVSFSASRWRTESASLLQEVHGRFAATSLAVRSSALSEDGFSASNAGRYRTLLRVPNETEALRNAVEAVIQSFDDDDPKHQIFVQPMVGNVTLSGVALTRSPVTGAPYYTLSFATGDATDGITSGAATDGGTIVIHRDERALPEGAPPVLEGLLQALAEIEYLTDHDALDVEFAIEEGGGVHVLQVRPVVVRAGRTDRDDRMIRSTLDQAATQLEALRAPPPRILGRRALWGVMPDWNPAEIIGTRPSRLAFSLYAHLVTDEVWATQRAEYGYRDVRPLPLVRLFGGQPYVDVRASFNSFVPASVPEATAAALVEHYLATLEARPELHDKVEFEVVPTCLGFDFAAWRSRLAAATGLGVGALDGLEEGLRAITRRAIERCGADRAAAENAGRHAAALGSKDQAPLLSAIALLDECRRLGTLPFAHLARAAFVAVTLLRSATAMGVLTARRVEEFLRSIRTVSHELASDAAAVRQGALSFETFVARYGHLRPGTYDIVSPCYADDPERFLRGAVRRAPPSEPPRFAWTAQEEVRLTAALHAAGLPLSIPALDEFLRSAIEGREYTKFAFTRSLSRALDYIADYGMARGMDREQLSHLGLDDLRELAHGRAELDDLGDTLEHKAARGRALSRIVQSIELPPLLRRQEDLFRFRHPTTHANFVTAKRVVGPCTFLENRRAEPASLAGHILLVPNADPGFDWLFSEGIAGLITSYGGTNSHMAIRAAEFDLPAAIGVGDAHYRRLSSASMLELNCEARQINVLQ
jgi:phosphohistidine swiveling domain-containing protein